MVELSKLAALMRKDWDRRVAHDYRFWMSDGHRDDRTMWESGARDFEIISAGVGNLDTRTALDIGCGVGRLIKPALLKCGKVIGIDVSQTAIAKARELLGDSPKLELKVGNGIDLSEFPTASIDFIWSFAALTSMPTRVIAAYLREMKRILAPDGVIRLQVYLGEEVLVSEPDTLQLRCFKRENFLKGCSAAGLKVTDIHELKLPFQVSFKEIGIEAFIASLENDDVESLDVETIATTLLPTGEPTEGSDIAPAEIEAWMSVDYAEKLAAEGDVERARKTLEYVEANCKTTSIDVRDILDRIVSRQPPTKTSAAETPFDSSPKTDTPNFILSEELYQKNLAVVREKFPTVAEQLGNYSSPDDKSVIEVRMTEQGPILLSSSQCLDHPEKPVSGANAWIERSIVDKKYQRAAQIVVFGFGAGYHLDALVEKFTGKVCCIEPSLATFHAAISTRDLTSTLRKLTALHIGIGGSLSFVTPDSELLVRPQTMATFGSYASEVKGLFYGKRGLASLHPKIGVIGPLQGGTLPITQYVYNAFARLDQRVRGLDVSGFNSAWHLIDQFAKFPPRQKAMHNAYIEMLSYILLETFTEKPVDILVCMAQAPVTPQLLLELRKRGVITVLWFVEDYLRFTYWKEIAKYYDFIFTIQKGECISAIKQAGAGEVHYLPTACDQGLHSPGTLTQEERERWGSPVSFVGAGYYNRTQVFASLAALPFKIWGTEWPGNKPFDRLVQENGRRLTPEEYTKIFAASEVNLNLHSSSERDGVDPFGDFLNPRVFELAAVGAFQLVDSRQYLGDCFEIGKEIITFNSTAELKDLIAYYLQHPEERKIIAERARARVLRDHTYDQRMEEMLSVIYATKYEQLKSREEQGPWGKMLTRAEDFPELKERCDTAFKRGEEPTLDALVSDIITGNGQLSETEQKLLFLHHVKKQIIMMVREGNGEKQ